MNKKMLAVAVLSSLLGGMMGAGGLYAASLGRAARVAYDGGALVGITMTGPTSGMIKIFKPYTLKSWSKRNNGVLSFELKK